MFFNFIIFIGFLDVNKLFIVNVGLDVVVYFLNRVVVLDGLSFYDDYGIVEYEWLCDFKSFVVGVSVNMKNIYC